MALGDVCSVLAICKVFKLHVVFKRVDRTRFLLWRSLQRGDGMETSRWNTVYGLLFYNICREPWRKALSLHGRIEEAFPGTVTLGFEG